MKRTVVLMMMGLLVGLCFGATPQIANVKAQQRYPWNGKVDVTFQIVGYVPEGRSNFFTLSATDRQTGVIYLANSSALSGDTESALGQHHVIWDMSAQGLTFKSSDVVFKVAYTEAPLYCVIDLSAGPHASSYPVTYMYTPPEGGFNTDTYKTTKLVMRRIDPGSCTMGDAYSAGECTITLTKAFYCGIFEVTQRQYELVMGTKPSYFNNPSYYMTRPVEQVSYDMSRGAVNGAGWPSSSAVDADSFMGRLRDRTGIGSFDLPTEAQWEYACRAGTTTALNSGKNITSENDANMAEVGRYYFNSGAYNNSYDNDGSTDETGTAKVGSYLPNAWGLYDMHGNVYEWCLDWFEFLSGGLAEDPKGPSSGADRVLRGGSWKATAGYCTSSIRDYSFPPGKEYDFVGFRLFRTLSE